MNCAAELCGDGSWCLRHLRPVAANGSFRVAARSPVSVSMTFLVKSEGQGKGRRGRDRREGICVFKSVPTGHQEEGVFLTPCRK